MKKMVSSASQQTLLTEMPANWSSQLKMLAVNGASRPANASLAGFNPRRLKKCCKGLELNAVDLDLCRITFYFVLWKAR